MVVAKAFSQSTITILRMKDSAACHFLSLVSYWDKHLRNSAFLKRSVNMPSRLEMYYSHFTDLIEFKCVYTDLRLNHYFLTYNNVRRSIFLSLYRFRPLELRCFSFSSSFIGKKEYLIRTASSKQALVCGSDTWEDDSSIIASIWPTVLSSTYHLKLFYLPPLLKLK